jgi:dihydropteroate synthase
MFTLSIKGKNVQFDSPVVMGIINATPDSFVTGHLHKSPSSMVDMAGKMLDDGASILDIGGQSTRPGSQRISAEEEADRVLPIIQLIHQHFRDALLSVDTYYSSVARMAIEAGASIINDISAGNLDEEMIQTASSLKIPYICMHMNTTPETMQEDISYQDVVTDVFQFLEQKVTECKQAGIQSILIDPGFGFGKTIEQNFSLLASLDKLNPLQCAILAGLSRKSMIYKTLKIDASVAINGTSCLNTLALMKGASILRVHDVKEAFEAITLFQAYKNAAQGERHF